MSNLESALRSTISHAALSAGLAFSLTGVAETALAQEVDLDTIDVEGATASEGDGTENTYVVKSASSPKQTAPLLNTPQTVTVVTKEVMEERGARDLTEVLRNTPGITFDAGENGFGTSMTNFKLRGFNASGDVFIDGSRDNGTYSRDMFNVDRVEIFKGPAADNGRGGAGGYVNLVTKSPVLENFIAGGVSFGFDEYDSEPRKRTTFDVNQMIDATTAFRLNGMWEDGGVAGREIAENNSWGIAPSLAFGLGTDTRAILSYEHLTRRDLPDWGVPAATIPGMMRFDPVAGTAPRDNFYGLRSDFDDVDADSFLARFEHDFADGSTISNQTRWAHVDRASRFTTLTNNPFGNPQPPLTTASTLDTQNVFYDRASNTITNLTNYSTEFHTGSVKHSVAMGVELSWEQSDANRQNQIAIPPSSAPANGDNSLFDPNPDRHPGFPMVPAETSRIDVQTVAAYLYDTIDIDRHWQITGGLRAEHYKVHIDSKTAAGDPLPLFDNFRATDTTLGGKIGVVYKPVEEVSYYAAASLSHLPPGSYLSNSDISREGDDSFPNLIPGADPVRAINYEIGVKRDFFGGRLSTTAALFHTDKRVPITGCTPNDPAGAFPFGGCASPIELKGYGNQIAQGLELGAAGNITDDWKVFGGLLWMKTEKRYSREQEVARMAAQTGDYPVGFRDGFSGDALSFTPELSAHLWTTYHVPNTKLTLGGGMQYVGASWAGRPDDAARIIPNGAFGKLPEYFLAHVMASYELRENVEVRFNIDNIFDKKYAVSANWPGQRVMLGAPRTYRLSANFRF